jgi:hypothetical protein
MSFDGTKYERISVGELDTANFTAVWISPCLAAFDNDWLACDKLVCRDAFSSQGGGGLRFAGPDNVVTIFIAGHDFDDGMRIPHHELMDAAFDSNPVGDIVMHPESVMCRR